MCFQLGQIKFFTFKDEMKKEGIHPDSPDWSHNGLVLAKKFGFEFEDLEKGIYPGSPEIGTHNEEGPLPRFVLSKILPAIFPSSEDDYSSEDEDLKRDWVAKEEKFYLTSEEEYVPPFCKDEKSFNVKNEF